MDNKIADCKLVMACTKQGMVEELYLDSGSLLENIELPVGLHSIVTQNSMKDLGRFWLAIQEKAVEENTVLRLRYKDKQHNYSFTGYLLNDKILLCGKTQLTDTEKALMDIMLINNDQANQIRLSEKEKLGNVHPSVREKGMEENFLNDFTAINNELINSKRELMQKNQEIELLNKKLNDVNDYMTTFTYSISHDLKEPVRNIHSLLSIFRDKYGDSLDPKGQKLTNMVLDGANRLSKMMSELLKYHQSSNFDNAGSVDLNETISEVRYNLQEEIEVKKARIGCEELPVVKGSAAGFRQVFQNLISNAIKFVAEGTTPEIFIVLEESESHYTFKVKDNGIGIAEKHKEDVFNLFRRLNAHQQYEGTGMGLAMVRKSVERMGGEVWIESELGKGSTVSFTVRKYANH